MKQTDPPAAMRERFEKWADGKGTMGQSWNGEYYENILHQAAWQGWQAAQPSSEKIEAVARRIAAGRGRREWPLGEDEIAAILREELGGGTE